MHIRDQVLHEVFLAEGVQDIIPLDDIIIKDACRLESDIYCLLRQLQTYRQVTDTVCYEIKLIRAHNPSFSIIKANIMNFYAKCECLPILLQSQIYNYPFFLALYSFGHIAIAAGWTGPVIGDFFKHMCSMKMVNLNTSGINAIFAETNNQTTRL